MSVGSSSLVCPHGTPDVITSILASVRGGRLPSQRTELHKTIYRLKSERKYRDILRDIYFDTTYSLPYSRQIDRSIYVLMASGVLTENKKGDSKYRIDSNSLRNIRKANRACYDAKHQTLINEIGKMIQKGI